MKLLPITACLALAALVSCKPKETLTVKIGSRSELVAIGDEWKTTQDEIISMIRPQWEGITSGNSVGFRFSRVVPDAETERRIGMRSGKGVKITATSTYGSPEWRFFRNREGMSGIEQLDDYGGEAKPMMSGASIEWLSLESYLREILITPDRVGIHNGEPVAASDGDKSSN